MSPKAAVLLSALCFALFLVDPQVCQAEPFDLPQGSYLVSFKQSWPTRSLERRYLNEARRYRAQGRYELARQSYALALSVCSSEKKLMEIRQELDGVELLLRTLR